ncbi:MAG TPA: hypothetical protein VK674_02855 [Candidatus Limnocylindria bacterium]|nr:hypothetical protein [Candidatus Limnocylindria bacterium]
MSLAANDLRQIRIVVREEVESTISARIDPRFDTLEGQVVALDNDIKETYHMVSELQSPTRPIAHIEKHDLEQKILASYKNIVAIAKEAGIALPRS